MPYRLEYAPSNRAGCQVKACKDAKTKIKKGELRIGVWVSTGQFESWQWRHWGCTTPKVLTNLRESLDDEDEGRMNLDLLDGYEDLEEEDKERVVKAIKEGHVAEEDAIGANKPSEAARIEREKEEAKERKKAEKKAAKEQEKKVKKKVKEGDDDDDEGDKEKAALESPKNKKKPGKKARNEKTEEDDNKTAKSAPKRKRSSKANEEKEAIKDESSTDEKPAPKAKRGRLSKAKVEADSDDEQIVPAPKKAKRSRTKKQEDVEDEVDEENGDPPVEEPEPASKRRKSAKSGSVKKTKAANDAPVAKRTSKRNQPKS